MKLMIAIAFAAQLSAAYAQDRPADALPEGSYKRSCSECKVANGKYLVCRSCKNGRPLPLDPIIRGGGWETGVSLDLKACPNGPVWNDHGQLRCGDG